MNQSGKNKYPKQGFSLVEVIISTIVMTMLMVSAIAYIQYGGKIWQDGHGKIASASNMRMALEVLRQDLLRAADISDPAVAAPGSAPTMSTALSYRISDIPDVNEISLTGNILERSNSSVATMSMRIARNVSVFEVTRISSWTLQIHIQIQGDEEDDVGNFPIIASETVIFMAPGAG